MKVALYNLTTTTIYGGVESFVWDLARELMQRGHEIHIIGGTGPRREQLPGVQVLTFPFLSRRIVQRIPPMRRAYAEAKLIERLSMALPAMPHLARAGYDIIHLQKPYDMAPALLARRLSGSRVILGCHGEDFYRGDRMLAARMDAAVSCSHFNARTVAARYGIMPTVVFNGIDTELFRPMPPDARITALRKDTSGNDVAILLFVGRFMPWKGIDTAIQALAHIPQARLVLAGDGQERPHLERLVADLGLSERVTFLGALPRHELPGVYAAADMLLATSYASETFGIGPVEAQACGLPVVASNFGGFPEVIEEGKTGLLVAPRDPQALAGAVQSLLAEPNRLRAMASRAPSWAAQFSWPAVTDRVEAVYRMVLAS